MSFKKTDNKHYYNPVRNAILNHQMIEPGDKVAIGMSGGKDSSTLLYFLDTISKQKRLGFEFEIVPISLDMAMGMDLTPMEAFVASLGYQLEVVPTQIAKVVFDIREEKNPCSLCANLRRGILYTHAAKLGCNKVALGHHVDDAIETYLMNFLLHGKLASFEPMSYLDKTKVSIIRPMLYLEETDIIHFVEREAIPVIHNPCPVDKKTKREEMKKLVTQLSLQYPDIRNKFVKGMEQGKQADFWQVSR
ncbi:tRNA 2-thiocytidine biosynthesis TtcA family protein [Isobaculum melis]|uniref:tRNA(Ile)-lysidine synthase TilS/MesJ n=1 Tax=Isobaculum melis TaxID=142588 RepID=A0A1H9QPB3_9LACT|nr:ATP-binding protein [Isobaculum melis]SER62055.1 tRNA(Ile)-lysidine synthase TilS/MesJ [Isobaculum melis]